MEGDLFLSAEAELTGSDRSVVLFPWQWDNDDDSDDDDDVDVDVDDDVGDTVWEAGKMGVFVWGWKNGQGVETHSILNMEVGRWGPEAVHKPLGYPEGCCPEWFPAWKGPTPLSSDSPSPLPAAAPPPPGDAQPPDTPPLSASNLPPTRPVALDLKKRIGRLLWLILKNSGVGLLRPSAILELFCRPSAILELFNRASRWWQ